MKSLKSYVIKFSFVKDMRILNLSHSCQHWGRIIKANKQIKKPKAKKHRFVGNSKLPVLICFDLKLIHLFVKNMFIERLLVLGCISGQNR